MRKLATFDSVQIHGSAPRGRQPVLSLVFIYYMGKRALLLSSLRVLKLLGHLQNRVQIAAAETLFFLVNYHAANFPCIFVNPQRYLRGHNASLGGDDRLGGSTWTRCFLSWLLAQMYVLLFNGACNGLCGENTTTPNYPYKFTLQLPDVVDIIYYQKENTLQLRDRIFCRNSSLQAVCDTQIARITGCVYSLRI